LSARPKGFLEEKEGEQLHVKISYLGQDKCTLSSPWIIDVGRETDIFNRLLKSDTIVNFSDDIAISTIYNGTLAEVFIIIAKLLKKELIEFQEQPNSGMYFRLVPKS
jgi:hypothetical protein